MGSKFDAAVCRISASTKPPTTTTYPPREATSAVGGIGRTDGPGRATVVGRYLWA